MRSPSGLHPLINYQLPGGASRLAALLLPYILPVCSVVAPCHPGAALRNLVLVQRIQATSFLTATIVLFACVTALAQGPTYQMGRTPTAEEIKASDTAISPEGKELPPGSGSATEGAKVFAQKCAACHGPTAMGTALARGLVPLGNTKPVKLEWSLVPYATTVWDFINRAMPQSKPGSLTAEEVYAVTAFVLFRNGIVKETDVLDARSLPKIRMPNRDNFLPVDPAKVEAKRPFGYYP